MSSRRFPSEAYNREDVVLARIFGGLRHGRYLDASPGDPSNHSVTRTLAADTWTGHVVEPDVDRADQLRLERPGSSVGPERTGSGSGPLHLAVVDLELLADVDLATEQPWVLVVRGVTADPSPVAGYTACLFDGISRFHVADEHASTYGPALSYPACALDDYDTVAVREAVNEAALEHAEAQRQAAVAAAATREAGRWRDAALQRWAGTVDAAAAAAIGLGASEVTYLREELDRVHETLSWRVTKPLRSVRGVAGSVAKVVR